MKAFFAGATILGVAIVVTSGSVGAVAVSEGLPRAFHGAWASKLAECTETGELSPMRVDGRFIVGYEHGWTIRSWSRRGDVWVGRGTADDDQGSMPATVKMRLRANGALDFISGARNPFTQGPGLVRCPARKNTRR